MSVDRVEYLRKIVVGQLAFGERIMAERPSGDDSHIFTVVVSTFARGVQLNEAVTKAYGAISRQCVCDSPVSVMVEGVEQYSIDYQVPIDDIRAL